MSKIYRHLKTCHVSKHVFWWLVLISWTCKPKLLITLSLPIIHKHNMNLKKQFYLELISPWPIKLFFQHFCSRIDFFFSIEKFSIEFRKPSLEILISKNFSFDWILNEIRHEHLRPPANSREQTFWATDLSSPLSSEFIHLVVDKRTTWCID
jgi:hypothetical protein